MRIAHKLVETVVMTGYVLYRAALVWRVALVNLWSGKTDASLYTRQQKRAANRRR